MSTYKFFVRGGGRWREIDLDTGRVSGWAGTRFVFTKRGKLCVAGRRAVLAGLKNLSQNKPTTVREGIQLPKIKCDDLKCSKTSRSIEEKHHCTNKHTSCNTDADFNNLLKPPTNTVAIQCSGELNLPNSVSKSVRGNINHAETKSTLIEKHSSTIETLNNDSANICKELEIDESDIETFRKFVKNDAKNIFNVDLLLYDEDDSYKQKIFYKISPIVKLVRDSNIRKILHRKNNLRLNGEMKSKYRMRRREIKNDNSKNKIGSDDRGIDGGNKISHSASEPNIKIVEFIEDTDSSNTLVENKRILDNRKQTGVDQGDSRSNLKGSKESGDGDKINGHRGSGDEEQVTSGNKDSRRNVEIEKDANKRNVKDNSGSKRIMLKPVFVKKVSANSESRANRDFSMLEDEAVVDWILKNGKAHCVKGNRIWKILEPIHKAITGQSRTWQSLRNRYLRYILPSLGSLSLSLAQATALRAAASAGEIKYRKEKRRNSIFKTVRVRSAWNARPVQKPKHSDDEHSSPPRLLRSNTTILSPSRGNLPTYSEITRRFAEKHRSTPNSDESDKRDKRSKKPNERAIKISETDKQDERKERDKNTDRKSRQLDRRNNPNVNDNISDEKRHRSKTRQGTNSVRIDTSSDRSERPNKIPKNDNDSDLQNNNRPFTRHSHKNRRNDTDIESDFESDSKNIRNKIQQRRKSNIDYAMGSENDKASENDLKNRIRTRQRRQSIAIVTNAEYNKYSEINILKNNRAEIEQRKRNNRSHKTDTEYDTDIESGTEMRMKARQRGKGIAVEKNNAENDKYSDKNVEKVKSKQHIRKRDKERKYKTDTEHDSNVDTDLETTDRNRRLRRNKPIKDQNTDNLKNTRNKSAQNGKTNGKDKSDIEHDSNVDTDIENASQSLIRTRQRRRSMRNDGADTRNGKNLEIESIKSGQIRKMKRNEKSGTDYDSNIGTDVDGSENQNNAREMRVNIRRSENHSKYDKNNENNKDSRTKSSHRRNIKTDRTDAEIDKNSPIRERRKNKNDQINTKYDNSVELDQDDDIKNKKKRRRIQKNMTDTENDTDFEKDRAQISEKRKNNRKNETDDSDFDLNKDSQISSAHQTDSEDLTDSSVGNRRPTTRQSIKSIKPEDTRQNPRNSRRDRDNKSTKIDRNTRERRMSSRIVFESNSDSSNDNRQNDEARKSDTEGYSSRRRERRMSIRSRNELSDQDINEIDDILKDKSEDKKVTRSLRRLFNPKVPV